MKEQPRRLIRRVLIFVLVALGIEILCRIFVGSAAYRVVTLSNLLPNRCGNAFNSLIAAISEERPPEIKAHSPGTDLLWVWAHFGIVRRPSETGHCEYTVRRLLPSATLHPRLEIRTREFSLLESGVFDMERKRDTNLD